MPGTDGPCTRREFFREAAGGLREGLRALSSGWGALVPEPLPAHPWARPQLFVRPPGSLPEAEFLAACTRCGDCIRACEPLALRRAGPEHGARLFETPIVVPAENPCVNCESLPCVAACGEGALRR